MNDTLIPTLISAFCRNGIPAYPEYPPVLLPLPNSAFFVTAAISAVKCDTPVNTPEGTALPAELTLRLRYYFRNGTDFPQYTADADECLAEALRTLHCNVSAIQRGELEYQKQLDRMELETRFILRGVISFDGTEAGAEA